MDSFIGSRQIVCGWGEERKKRKKRRVVVQTTAAVNGPYPSGCRSGSRVATSSQDQHQASYWLAILQSEPLRPESDHLEAILSHLSEIAELRRSHGIFATVFGSVGGGGVVSCTMSVCWSSVGRHTLLLHVLEMGCLLRWSRILVLRLFHKKRMRPVFAMTWEALDRKERTNSAS